MKREEFDSELRKINREANERIVRLMRRMENPPIVSGGFRATYSEANTEGQKKHSIHPASLPDKQ